MTYSTDSTAELRDGAVWWLIHWSSNSALKNERNCLPRPTFYQCQPQNLEHIKTKPMHTEPMMMPSRKCRSMECNCSYSCSNFGRAITFLR